MEEHRRAVPHYNIVLFVLKNANEDVPCCISAALEAVNGRQSHLEQLKELWSSHVELRVRC